MPVSSKEVRMVIMILEKVSPSLRGELTRWLLEARTGVFIGHVSAMVRDRLWDKCCRSRGVGGVLQAWSTNNEQRFTMRSHGDTSRRIVEIEGVQLVMIPTAVASESIGHKPVRGEPHSEV
jgi:CRISPR-associated protein Cas2